MLDNSEAVPKGSIDPFVDLACRLTPDGIVTEVLHTADYLMSLDSLTGHYFEKYVDASEFGTLQSAMRQCQTQNDSVEITFSFTGLAGNQTFRGLLKSEGTDEGIFLSARVLPDEIMDNNDSDADVGDQDGTGGDTDFRMSLLESLAETMDEGILVVDRQREIVFHNRRFREIWNVPADELKSRSSDRALKYVLDQLENPDEFKQKLYDQYDNPRERNRDLIRCKDGRIIDQYSAPVLSDDGTFHGRLWGFREVTRQKRREEELNRLTRRYELALDATRTGFFEWEVETRTADWDDRTQRLFELDDSSVSLCYHYFLERIHPQDRRKLKSRAIKTLRTRESFQAEFRVRTNNQVRWIQLHGDLVTQEDGSRKLIGLQRDVSNRKRTQRALEVTTQCRESIIRSSDEQQLLENICEELTSESGYEFAWIGYAQTDQTMQFEPVAASDPDHSYLEDLDVRWSYEPEGRGPSGVAFREERPVASQNVRTDEQFRPWRDKAQDEDFGSSLAVPLVTEDSKLGTINIYARTPYVFGEKEREWLQQLADDVAYGVQVIRTERQLEKKNMSLEEKTTLLDEIHHRVKNNMQVMNSLINYHTRFMEEEASKGLMEDCQDRIQSMAMVHETLYQSDNLAEIALQKYVRSLAENIMNSYTYDEDEVAIDLQIDPYLNLPLEKTISCGLIIHEFITNSFQHAFESGRDNELFVDVSKKSGRVTIVVRDNGPGFPEDLITTSDPDDSSVGLGIVEALGCYELDGELEFTNDPQPTAQLTFEL